MEAEGREDAARGEGGMGGAKGDAEGAEGQGEGDKGVVSKNKLWSASLSSKSSWKYPMRRCP